MNLSNDTKMFLAAGGGSFFWLLAFYFKSKGITEYTSLLMSIGTVFAAFGLYFLIKKWTTPKNIQ